MVSFPQPPPPHLLSLVMWVTSSLQTLNRRYSRTPSTPERDGDVLLCCEKKGSEMAQPADGVWCAWWAVHHHHRWTGTVARVHSSNTRHGVAVWMGPKGGFLLCRRSTRDPLRGVWARKVRARKRERERERCANEVALIIYRAVPSLEVPTSGLMWLVATQAPVDLGSTRLFEVIAPCL